MQLDFIAGIKHLIVTRSPYYNVLGHGLCNCFTSLRGFLHVEVEPMTHAELRKKIIDFVHGRDSHGGWLVPWKHDLHCTWCDLLVGFIDKLLESYDTFDGKVYPKK